MAGQNRASLSSGSGSGDQPDQQNIAGYSWFVVSAMMVTFTFSHMDRNIMSILLNSIKADLGLSDFEAGLMHGFAFAVFYVTLGLPIARAADRMNRVNIISLALVAWSAMTAFCGLAQNFTQLLIARMGVGIGEAGCVPPAQSIIADYIPKERRTFAMSLFAIGAPVGTLLGILVGGIVESYFGWRYALIAVGVPGIAVALAIKLTIREPVRGMADGVQVGDTLPPSVLEVIQYIWSCRSLRHMIFASALIVFGGYGTAAWIPAFLERSHDLSTLQTSLWLGPVMLIGGVGGALFAGRLTDRLIERDVSWYAMVPAIATIIAVPFSTAIVLIPQTTYHFFGLQIPSYAVAIPLLAVPGAALIAYIGPVNALMQRMVRLRMRAMTVAIFLFVTNLIGMGLGPVFIGLASDYFSVIFGDEGLRVSLFTFLFVYVWASWHFLQARHNIADDLAKIEG